MNAHFVLFTSFPFIRGSSTVLESFGMLKYRINNTLKFIEAVSPFYLQHFKNAQAEAYSLIVSYTKHVLFV